MSDVSLTPLWERDIGDLVKGALNPESAMDLLDPGQHFQGEFYTEEKVEAETKRVEGVEKTKIETEKKEAAAKKLEAQRKARRTSAGRTGRRASIATSALGVQGESNVRRASLGGRY